MRMEPRGEVTSLSNLSSLVLLLIPAVIFLAWEFYYPGQLTLDAIMQIGFVYLLGGLAIIGLRVFVKSHAAREALLMLFMGCDICLWAFFAQVAVWTTK